MSKPTIFFSHSTRDKDMILLIKNKLDIATNGVLDIFMSSDGQSIPFGTNWVYKVEEGLQLTKVMFVFVTERSVSSGWIYFEAGYAYSKGVQVIPVGIGINIGSLKAPLNLLQGFNITSEDGLNNFISIINKTFEYRFSDVFEKKDYQEVMALATIKENNIYNFEKIIGNIEFSIYSKGHSNGKVIEYDIESIFNDMVKYLDNHFIKYSRDNEYQGNKRKICLMVYGIKIIYYIGRKKEEGNIYSTEELSKIYFKISSFNFEKSFELFKNLLLIIENSTSHYLRISLNDDYRYITTDEDIASIISASHYFEFNEDYIGGYHCCDLDLKFYFFNEIDTRKKITNYLMSIVFDCETVNSNNIMQLINLLCEIGIIYKK